MKLQSGKKPPQVTKILCFPTFHARFCDLWGPLLGSMPSGKIALSNGISPLHPACDFGLLCHQQSAYLWGIGELWSVEPWMLRCSTNLVLIPASSLPWIPGVSIYLETTLNSFLHLERMTKQNNKTIRTPKFQQRENPFGPKSTRPLHHPSSASLARDYVKMDQAPTCKKTQLNPLKTKRCKRHWAHTLTSYQTIKHLTSQPPVEEVANQDGKGETNSKLMLLPCLLSSPMAKSSHSLILTLALLYLILSYYSVTTHNIIITL